MKPFFLFTLAILATAWSAAPAAARDNPATPATKTSVEVVHASEVKWGPLNPARGDKSPQAGTLWGDRASKEPAGFLLKPVDGFESPPHIHNVSYRGVVIKGVFHNDDPSTSHMWLSPGSFWTQPKGDVHITAAKGSDALAYIEIDEGPYLVMPPKAAFPSKAKPINVDRTNLVWLDASNIVWIEQAGQPGSADGPKVAFLWGTPQDGQLSGSLVRLPAGFAGKIHSRSSTFRAVVIKGQARLRLPGQIDIAPLEAGSYFRSKGEMVHQVSSSREEETIFYIRANGKYDIIQDKK